jgi:hypothetical protein
MQACRKSNQNFRRYHREFWQHGWPDCGRLHFESRESQRQDWQLAFMIFAAINHLGALCWSSIDPLAPLEQREEN